MISKIFKTWTVLELADSEKPGKRYLCLCSCGNKEIKVGAELKRGRGTTCSSCNPSIRYDTSKEIGKKYGKWTIVEKVAAPKNSKISPLYFKCQCDCGTISNIRFDGIRKGRSSQCRECSEKERYIDVESMIGKKIGKWFIHSIVENNGASRKLLCKCECGKELIKPASILKLGKSLQCLLCNVVKHGYEGSRTYTSWRSMLRRCTNPKSDNYHRYGGRGITICERWHKFDNFLEDMGERPEGLELDRTNNEGNYEPSNCKWVTKSANALNRRKRPILWNKK